MTGHMSDEYGFLKCLARFYFSFYFFIIIILHLEK